MSQGKYSPRCPHAGDVNYEYIYNSLGDVPHDYDHTKDDFDSKLHFGNYDDEGYDEYGYSAWDGNGDFVGAGNGVDRLGYTEMEYMDMDYDHFCALAG